MVFGEHLAQLSMSDVVLRASYFNKCIVMKPSLVSILVVQMDFDAQVVSKMCSRVCRESLEGVENLKKIKRWRQSGQLYGNQA